ncbi:MAG: DNA-processing protein DprA [Planctomycetota bacterium]|nr:DNA-processing protein DprA [Planctomycetota bacterium]
MDVEKQTADRTDALLRLLSAEGIGHAIARRLINGLGSPEAVLGASSARIASSCGLRHEAATLVARAIEHSDPTHEQQQLDALQGRFLLWSEPGYPEPLCRIPDPPPVLRIVGGSLAQQELAVAIVGTRRCTTYGRRQAARFASVLASAGITIVSGGARGIDGEAHRAALRCGGKTIVVLGSGLGCLYPAEHEPLFKDVVTAGGTLVSEFPVNQPPRPGQFPRRNRIVAGLCIGVLVVEAPCRSGAMITARLAVEEQGRDAWAVPGSVDHRTSAGCHAAIAQGWAALVDSPEALLQFMHDGGWFRSSGRSPVAPA